MTNTTKLAAAVADFRACHTDHDTDAAALKAVASRHKGVTEAALQGALETPVTKGLDAVAKGAYKSRRIASRSTGKRVAKDGTVSEAKPADASPKAPTKAKPADASPKAPTKAKANTFTSVDLAQEHGINAKTLRARIRRNIDKWAPLFKDGEKHVFADNATTRKAVAALLDA